jgi:2-hydroxychromene-2-carboxylate isomerase
MTNIRVYHAFRSPYSRLGLHVIDRAGLDVELIPFTGPPDGVTFSDPTENKPKLAYYGIDAPRMTMRMGLPMKRPSPFEVDLGPANKGAVAAQRDGKGLAFALSVADARWGEGKNVSDIAVLEACAEQCGWGADALRGAQEEADITATLQRQRDQITEDGVFGVPFAVRGATKYWGHDRFDLLVEDAKE